MSTRAGCSGVPSIACRICRHMVAASADALFVAFMGTKQQRDILANAKIGMTPLWQDASHSRVRVPRKRGMNVCFLPLA